MSGGTCEGTWSEQNCAATCGACDWCGDSDDDLTCGDHGTCVVAESKGSCTCAAGWYTAACDLECADSAPDTFDSSWPSECNSVCCDESGLGSEGCPPANATEILQSEGFTNGYKDLCLATCSVCTPASVKDVAALAKKTRGRSIVALPTSREDQDSTENDVVIYYYNPADTTRPPTSGWLKDATSPQTLVTYVV